MNPHTLRTLAYVDVIAGLLGLAVTLPPLLKLLLQRRPPK
jgi:hypothetical protein